MDDRFLIHETPLAIWNKAKDDLVFAIEQSTAAGFKFAFALHPLTKVSALLSTDGHIESSLQLYVGGYSTDAPLEPFVKLSKLFC